MRTVKRLCSRRILIYWSCLLFLVMLSLTANYQVANYCYWKLMKLIFKEQVRFVQLKV